MTDCANFAARRWPMLATVALLWAVPATAQEDAPPAQTEAKRRTGSDSVLLGGGDGAAGRIAVNAAAGSHNQQANVGVIAIGGAALAGGSVHQLLAQPATTGGTASAVIAADAFRGSHGLLSVNAAAGSDNQQANLAVIAIGIEGQAIADTALSQARASQQPEGGTAETPSPERQAGIAPGAFADSRGLVQVNLVGGERNSSANLFALTVSAGAKQ